MYVRKYFIRYKNRQLDDFTVYILEKDYTGDVTELEGGPDPFTLRKGADSILTPIEATAATIQYYNNGDHPLETFASNSDDKYKIEHYKGLVLKWSGFLVQDDCAEPLKPAPYLVTLQATDNLGLLKGLTFNSTDFTPLYYKYFIYIYLEKILAKTGLSLPINVYCNVFESGMIDRSVTSTNGPFIQATIDSRTFLKDRNDFDDYYTILEKILSAWGCTLMQCEGEWQVVRWYEAKDFNNAIPGTRYINFASSLDATTPAPVSVGLDLARHPLNANQVKTLVRPSKSVKLTFNYEQPYKLIYNDDLLIVGALRSTSMDGTTKIDVYEVEDFTYYLPTSPTYSIVVKTNTITGQEIDRYMVIPKNASFTSFVLPNLITVNVKDRFVFTLRFRGNTDTSDNIIFRFGFLLRGVTVNWSLTNVSGKLVWNNIGTGTTANSLTQTVLASDDLTEWRTMSLFENTTDEYIPPIPEDGELEIQIKGFNDTNVSQPNREAWIKDITFEYITYINDSTQIIGHVHTSEQAETIKQKQEETIFVDDAPKNNVRGVMFLSNGTTKTSLWNGGKPFGYVQKVDRMFVNDAVRYRVEGDFFGMHDLSMMSIVELADLPGVYFLMGQVTFNYAKAVWSGTMEELWREGEVFDETLLTNTFKYLYRNQ